MSGFFGVVSKKDCVMPLFFGVDYHSHLGTKRGGMAVYGPNGFQRSIHNIENSPFRTKFERDVTEMEGNCGIGCISDNEAQPLLVSSHLGSFAITTVGRINNIDELKKECFDTGKVQFLEMSHGLLNPTELVAALINCKDNLIEGIRYAQERINGSMSIKTFETFNNGYFKKFRIMQTGLTYFEKNFFCINNFDMFGRTSKFLVNKSRCRKANDHIYSLVLSIIVTQ